MGCDLQLDEVGVLGMAVQSEEGRREGGGIRRPPHCAQCVVGGNFQEGAVQGAELNHSGGAVREFSADAAGEGGRWLDSLASCAYTV